MKKVVIKIGGSLAVDETKLAEFVAAVSRLPALGFQVALVHGGGKEINENIGLLKEEPQFIDGLRVTTPSIMKMVEMTLSGAVNKKLVRLFLQNDCPAVGISGVDGGLFKVVKRKGNVDLGLVGEICAVDTKVIDALWNAGFIPVVSPISFGNGLSWNVNADTAASELASALSVDQFVLVSDVPGVMDLEKKVLPELSEELAEKLIVDGRIHPARIEEMVEKAQKEVETMIREEGESAALEVGVHGIHPELIKLLGRMKYRTSYGQNALRHSVEVAILSGLLAAEIGVDVRLAKRAGLLHDIGKSIDREMEGTHVQIGVDLCRKYKESAIVINAVEAHHGDVEFQSLIACIVQAADTISAARPGARRETLEAYTNRLKQLEDITNSFKGVDKSFAIQAGREVRVMVVPEHVSDDDMVLLARELSKKIEAELEYPGQIKINVIRESRVVDYAK